MAQVEVERKSETAVVTVDGKVLCEVEVPETVTNKGLVRRARKAVHKAGLVDPDVCPEVSIKS